MGLNELREKYFWRAVFVEFFATALFIYLVTTVLINLNPTTTGGATIVQISFAIGLAISVFIQVFGPISGAHINPAVTIGVLINGGCSIIKAVFYTLAQLIGGMVLKIFLLCVFSFPNPQELVSFSEVSSRDN